MEKTPCRCIIDSDKLSIGLIIVLLILRFPFLFAGAFGIIDRTIAMIVYLCATYFCTGLFICINRGRLEQFNFSISALVIFLIAPALALITDGMNSAVLIMLLLSIAFALFILCKRNILFVKIPPKKITTNVLLTLPLCIAIPLLDVAISGNFTYKGDSISTKWVIEGLIFQLSTAAICEEPLFRGFLFGYLRKHGVKEWKICLIVAMLFWAGHIYYMDTGLNFWIFHPIVNLLLSFIVMKTKTVSYSMALHSCINGLPDLFRYAINALQFVKL